MRAPFAWFGGKGNMTAKLRKLIPQHRTYCEPFFGAGSVFFDKAAAEVETINDLDSAVAGFFKVLREQPEEFCRLANLTEYGRELWLDCRATWAEEPDPVRRAWKWWVVARMSFSGRFGGSISTVVTASDRGMAGTCSKFLSCVDLLPEMSARLRRVQIENIDALTVLERYCTEDGFAYLDPPYVQDTRQGGIDNPNDGRYVHEMTDADHAALVDALLRLPGKFLLSGYAQDVYAPLEAAGWRRIDWQTGCYAAGRTRASGLQGEGSVMSKQGRTESAWLCPATAAEVLDPEQLELLAAGG